MGLNNLLKLLLENKIDFVLVGGFAGVVHGSSLVTQDIDVCAGLSAEAIERLRSVLATLHPVHRMTPQKLSFLTEPRQLEGIRNLYLDTDLGPLDLLTEVKGVGDFDRVKREAVTISLFGHQCKVLCLADLILAKQAMGREKDRIAVQELRAIKEKGRKA